MTRFAAITDVLAAVGSPPADRLGTTGWRTVSAADVASFVSATGAQGWLHTDAGRARSAGPYGRPVVHGHLTLALATPMLAELLVVEGWGIGVNYGFDRVRFPEPVPVGSKVRGSGLLLSAVRHPPAVRLVVELSIECDTAPRPVCVAQLVWQLLPGPPPTP